MCLEPNCTDTTPRAPLDLPLSRKVWIDGSVTLDEKNVPRVRSGVVMGDGDGTVSLLSLGSMCVEGWKVRLSLPLSSSAGELLRADELGACSQRPLYNPAGIEVVTHEILHAPLAFDPRGGPTTADHVRSLSLPLVDVRDEALTLPSCSPRRRSTSWARASLFLLSLSLSACTR